MLRRGERRHRFGVDERRAPSTPMVKEAESRPGPPKALDLFLAGRAPRFHKPRGRPLRHDGERVKGQRFVAGIAGSFDHDDVSAEHRPHTLRLGEDRWRATNPS